MTFTLKNIAYLLPMSSSSNSSPFPCKIKVKGKVLSSRLTGVCELTYQ